jgi:hypothetical protein
MIKILGISNFKKFLEEKDKRDIGTHLIDRATCIEESNP